MPISVFFKSQCPKIMVLSKALKAKLSSIPSGIASLSTLASIGTEAEKPPPPLRAFVRPPAVATTRARPHWRASLGINGVVRAEFRVLSLLVEEGRSTFGVMAGIWAKF